jgi:predicted DNA-binding ribbon-helix-helix protein
MAVAVGEQRRKREAMDQLVNEISKGEEENIASLLRVAIEVRV